MDALPIHIRAVKRRGRVSLHEPDERASATTTEVQDRAERGQRPSCLLETSFNLLAGTLADLEEKIPGRRTGHPEPQARGWQRVSPGVVAQKPFANGGPAAPHPDECPIEEVVEKPTNVAKRAWHPLPYESSQRWIHGSRTVFNRSCDCPTRLFSTGGRRRVEGAGGPLNKRSRISKARSALRVFPPTFQISVAGLPCAASSGGVRLDGQRPQVSAKRLPRPGLRHCPRFLGQMCFCSAGVVAARASCR